MVRNGIGEFVVVTRSSTFMGAFVKERQVERRQLDSMISEVWRGWVSNRAGDLRWYIAFSFSPKESLPRVLELKLHRWWFCSWRYWV